MNRLIQYKITAYQASIRDFLKEQGYPRGILTALKNTPHTVRRNNQDALLRQELWPNDVLDILIEDLESSQNITAMPMPISIIYEDEDILVVDKPAGVPIHPSINHHADTLANGLMAYYRAQGLPFVFRCMNRLDRDTSGLTLLAKNPLSAALLSAQVKSKQLQRTYLCIATQDTGNIPMGCTQCLDMIHTPIEHPEDLNTMEAAIAPLEGLGTINAPIGRLEGSTIERCIDWEHGKSAITHYQVLPSLTDSMLPVPIREQLSVPLNQLNIKNGFSLVSLQLETGRTHQIRVHMRHIGHPLPGDFLYNPDMTEIKRQALHSYQLDFIHPITHAAMTLQAPLPADMLAFYGLTD